MFHHSGCTHIFRGEALVSNDGISNSPLGGTAYWTAGVRARESRREDRLFSDPWAAALAGETGENWCAQHTEESTLPIVVRTRYFDDFLRNISLRESIRNVVLMGAGLDTRAFRINWRPGVQFFELDQRVVLDYKETILHSLEAKPTCERQIICTNLTQPWKDALLESGFNPNKRSVWLLEGLLFYLPCESVGQILDAVDSLAATGSRLGFDIINSAVLSSHYTKAWIDMQAESGAPWISFMDDPEAFLAIRDWSAALSQAGQPDAHYGRWTLPILPTKVPNMPHYWFVTAKKE
jgi:methyltransferase (TIGR00027 family)